MILARSDGSVPALAINAFHNLPPPWLSEAFQLPLFQPRRDSFGEGLEASPPAPASPAGL